jgi:hypothetical protein
MTNEQQPNIVRTIPIEPQIQEIQPAIRVPSEKIKVTYSYSKALRLFATIEAFFLFLYGFYQPWFFIQAIGPIAGFYGAKKYHKFLSYFYFSYLILALFSKIVILSLTFQNNDIYYILLSIFTVLIDIWVLKISTAFIHHLHDLTDDERKNLRAI